MKASVIAPPLAPLALAATAALLPSCTRWQLAENLSDRRVLHLGVDTARPVDGKVYYPANPRAEGGSVSYMRAPEVTYRVLSDPVINSFGMQRSMPAPQDIRPTGRNRLVRLDRAGRAQEVAALPRGLRVEQVAPRPDAPMPAELDTPPLVGNLDPLHCATVATCDYVVDPLLTVLSCTLEGACYVAAAPFVGLYTLAAGGTQQQAEPPTTPQR